MGSSPGGGPEVQPLSLCGCYLQQGISKIVAKKEEKAWSPLWELGVQEGDYQQRNGIHHFLPHSTDQNFVT